MFGGEITPIPEISVFPDSYMIRHVSGHANISVWNQSCVTIIHQADYVVKHIFSWL